MRAELILELTMPVEGFSGYIDVCFNGIVLLRCCGGLVISSKISAVSYATLHDLRLPLSLVSSSPLNWHATLISAAGNIVDTFCIATIAFLRISEVLRIFAYRLDFFTKPGLITELAECHSQVQLQT